MRDRKGLLFTLAAIATIITFLLLDGPTIMDNLFSGPAPPASDGLVVPGSVESGPTEAVGRLDIRKDSHFMGITDWDIYYVKGSTEVLLFENLYNTSEIALSPSKIRAVALTSGVIHVANTDGSSNREWELRAGPSGMQIGRPMEGLAFVDDQTIRCRIELMENDDWVGIRLGGVSLSGPGTYEVTFDGYNHVTSAQRVR